MRFLQCLLLGKRKLVLPGEENRGFNYWVFDWQRQVRSGLNPKSADTRTTEWKNRDSTAVLKGARSRGYGCF